MNNKVNVTNLPCLIIEKCGIGFVLFILCIFLNEIYIFRCYYVQI